jgi:hypothetical protein
VGSREFPLLTGPARRLGGGRVKGAGATARHRSPILPCMPQMPAGPVPMAVLLLHEQPHQEVEQAGDEEHHRENHNDEKHCRTSGIGGSGAEGQWGDHRTGVHPL